MEWLVMIVLIGCGAGVMEKWLSSRVKIAELRAKQTTGGNSRDIEAVRIEMAAMREEIKSLRDTSMQYDLSFDQALQRMERRVEQVEHQQRIAQR